MKDKQNRDKKANNNGSENGDQSKAKVRKAMPKLKQLRNTDAQQKVGGKAQGSGMSCLVPTCF